MKGRTVTLWVCLDSNARCGVWYSDETQAAKNRENWAAMFPVEIPVSVYSGKRGKHRNVDRVERPPARAACRDVSSPQPTARNAAAAIPEADLEDLGDDCRHEKADLEDLGDDYRHEGESDDR